MSPEQNKHPYRLDGKTALVTGAARGIGAAVAQSLAAAGARVLLSDQNPEAAETTAAKLRQIGAQVQACQLDVTCEAHWQAAIGRAEAAFGPLQILVNNAGIETAALITECSLDDFNQVMAVNVNGVFLGLKHAIRAMSPQGSSGQGGSIVNLCSVAGMVGTTGHAAYHSSKGAVRALNKAAAVECAQLGTGIRVNAVLPAIVQTAMGGHFIQGFVDLRLAPDYAAAEAAIKSAHPMGRFGLPIEVANAVLYLASDASSWTTGSELVLDGGYTAV